MKVIVVGAGVAGLAAAYRAAQAGHTVHVLDPALSQPALTHTDQTQAQQIQPAQMGPNGIASTRAAAHVAAGRLAPVVEVEFGESDMTRLCLQANQRWRSWAEQLTPFTSDTNWYHQSGMIVAARDADDTAAIRRLADYQTSLGLDVEALSARALRKLEPALSPNVVGGMLVRQDHMVDNRVLLATLHNACNHHGATFIAEQAIQVGATEVTTNANSYQADAVVLAAGAWISTIKLEAELTLPTVHPVKGQILRLQGVPTSVFPTYPIDGLDIYLVPRRSRELVVGASVEDLGFDETITAGAVHELLKRARELVPGIDEMALVETAVGFRPATANHLPVIGPLGPTGPFIASGLYRNGILLAPMVGDEALRWLEGQPASSQVQPFAPAKQER